MFGIVFLVALLIGLGPNPERDGRLLLGSGPPKKANGEESVIPHYRVEFLIGIMVFFFNLRQSYYNSLFNSIRISNRNN